MSYLFVLHSDATYYHPLQYTLGTLAALFLVSLFVSSHQLWFAIGIGVIFTLGSLSLALRLGQFNWIGIIEIVQYVPISYLGYKLWERNCGKELIQLGVEY